MEIKEYIEKQLLYCSKIALNSTCQLFYRANAIGSGVFIETRNNKYLVSAAHVLESDYINAMTIPNGEILVEIQGVLIITEVPIGGIRDDDKFDIAVVQLTEDCYKEVEKQFSFLTINEIDSEHVKLNSHQYVFCGYPIATTVVKNMEMKIHSDALKVRTKMLTKDLLIVPSYPNGSKWILDYNRNNQFNIRNQMLQLSTHPKGVSGGGLWTIPFNPEIKIENTDMKLIGIMTDFFEQHDNAICATNIKLILDIINTNFEKKK